MKSWNQYLEQVGYDIHTKAPESKFVYYGYKEGKAQKFKTQIEAQGWSKQWESVLSNKEEIAKFWDDRQAKEAQAQIHWYHDLQAEYDHLPAKVFEVCYNEAYDRSHAYGYDEVASRMTGVVHFAEQIMDALK